MKTYSIGRDLTCDIVINDSTDVISRRHALLNITPSGKMTIIDQSSNGTYVNGIRISQNVPVPVTRKDIVSLAHVAKLDWNQVPKSNQWNRYAIIVGIIIVVILGAIFGIRHFKSNQSNNSGMTSNPTEQLDSTALKQKEAARLDSIKKVEKQDSVNKVADKAHRDATKSTKKVTTPKKDPKKAKEEEDKSKDKKEKGKSSQTKNWTIG